MLALNTGSSQNFQPRTIVKVSRAFGFLPCGLHARQHLVLRGNPSPLAHLVGPAYCNKPVHTWRMLCSILHGKSYTPSTQRSPCEARAEYASLAQFHEPNGMPASRVLCMCKHLQLTQCQAHQGLSLPINQAPRQLRLCLCHLPQPAALHAAARRETRLPAGRLHDPEHGL